MHNHIRYIPGKYKVKILFYYTTCSPLVPSIIGYISDTYWVRTWYLLDIYLVHTSYLSGTYKVLDGYVPDIYKVLLSANLVLTECVWIFTGYNT